MAHRRSGLPQPCNFVARDDCWKKYIESELEAARRWSHKWGFLKTPLEELIEDEKKENTKPKIQLPEHLQIRPVTPVEKYIKVIPSPPVPKTTQGFIGWRSAVPGLELEHGFQIQSCKGTEAAGNERGSQSTTLNGTQASSESSWHRGSEKPASVPAGHERSEGARKAVGTEPFLTGEFETCLVNSSGSGSNSSPLNTPLTSPKPSTRRSPRHKCTAVPKQHKLTSKQHSPHM